MAETSAIEWTDATINFWWGCTKVGPGCDFCYAEDYNRFRGTGEWGPGAARRWIMGSTALIKKLHWQHDKFFAEHGRHRRVFIQSMSDLFDNEVDDLWRSTAFDEIEFVDRLDVQIVTKRVSNIEKMVPEAWRTGRWSKHVGVLITVCTQPEADRDIPRLLHLKRAFGVPWVGLSIEPLLNATSLKPEWLEELDWVIVGGESGPHARPMHPDWARHLRDQCAAAGVPFTFKQWGAWKPLADNKGVWPTHSTGGALRLEASGAISGQGWPMQRVGKKAAGRMLDDRIHDAWPEVTRCLTT